MALAAYNVGMAHLEEARRLTEGNGQDPHLWQDVRAQLPDLRIRRFIHICATDLREEKKQ
jgi:membrane-bound lytic murein transglycosylase F